MCLRGGTQSWALGVHGAGHLAEATVDALGLVRVLVGGLAAAVGGGLRLNGDGLGRAESCTKLTGKACRAPLQMDSGTVHATPPPLKAWAQWALLEWVLMVAGSWNR